MPQSVKAKFGWLSPVIGNKWSDFEPIVMYQEILRCRANSPGQRCRNSAHRRRGATHATEINFLHTKIANGPRHQVTNGLTSRPKRSRETSGELGALIWDADVAVSRITFNS